MQVELFLNSFPILKNLSSDERKRVAGALEELVFDKGARVIQQVSVSGEQFMIHTSVDPKRPILQTFSVYSLCR